jgi:hypothetical protein
MCCCHKCQAMHSSAKQSNSVQKDRPAARSSASSQAGKRRTRCVYNMNVAALQIDLSDSARELAQHGQHRDGKDNPQEVIAVHGLQSWHGAAAGGGP